MAKGMYARGPVTGVEFREGVSVTSGPYAFAEISVLVATKQVISVVDREMAKSDMPDEGRQVWIIITRVEAGRYGVNYSGTVSITPPDDLLNEVLAAVEA
jgi:hypothetical protein